MRLLVVTRETGDDRRYGIGQSVGRIADGLRDNGHDVRYVTQVDCAELHARWQPLFARWLTRFGAGSAALALAERCVQGMWAASEALRWQASHVWLQDPWLAFGLQLGLYRRRRPSRQFSLIISQHGLGAFSRAVTLDGLVLSNCQLALLLRLEARILARADAVICPSHAVRDALMIDLRRSELPNHWHVMGYGRPARPTLSRNEARRALLLPDDIPVIVAMGRLAPVKRYPELLRAIADLEHFHGISSQLVIAGGGDAETLLQMARQLGISRQPIIGPVEHPSSVLAAADLYVSACEVEAFGMANREALAAQLPCVVAPGGASQEVLGEGAWLVPARRNTLAAAMSSVLSDPNVEAFWRRQAYAATQRWPSWESLFPAYETLFLELSNG